MHSAILVDTSYLVYYNGFAAWTWYKREIGTKGIPKDGSFDPMSDPEYKAMFEKKFLSRIYGVIRKEVVFFDKSSLIFCMDCNRKKIWRCDVFPEYKMMRKSKQDQDKEFDWNGIFTYVENILLPKYRDEYGCRIIKHPNAEGDDIIATLTEKLYEDGCREIVIVGSDGDLTQLSDKAKIFTLKGQQKTYQTVIDKYKFKEQIEWDKDLFLVHKCIMGDGGDEIPPIMPGLGPKRAVAYINNFEELEKLLKENEEAAEKFKINTQLINFQYIPKEIRENVIAQFESTTENDITSL